MASFVCLRRRESGEVGHSRGGRVSGNVFAAQSRDFSRRKLAQKYSSEGLSHCPFRRRKRRARTPPHGGKRGAGNYRPATARKRRHARNSGAWLQVVSEI